MSFIREREDKFLPQYETPEKPVISEGDILIKNLLEKQLNKNIRLQDELSHKKQFETPIELINETKFLSGQSNLETFQQTREYLGKIEELKSFGLTDEEVELYLDNEKGENYIFSKHKNVCHSILQEKLNYALEKLKHKTENSLKRNSNKISRHVKEIALSTKPESLETKLFIFATSCSNNEDKKLKQPIDELPQLEKDLFTHLNNPKIPLLKKRRKKAKKYLDSEIDDTNFNTKTELSIKKQKLESKWDLKEVPFEEPINREKEKKVYTCKPQKNYTIRNNQIIEIKTDKKCETNCVNDHKEYKNLNEEEIKQLSRFQTYEKGTPSKVLFIKNLAKQVNEQDLIKLFDKFDNKNKISYRLMTGKMKGQAFVTFDSVDQATKALESVNGIIIKNKPIIIQYGKSA